MATAHRFAETAAPEPELDPHGFRLSAYGLRVCPPRPLHPLDERVERKFAHSLRLALARMTAPASRSFCATNESRGAMEAARASEPAVVCIRSAVSMLSLITTGMPWSGPRTFPSRRSRSRAAAISNASGFLSMIAFTPGPPASTSSMRARYFSTRDRAVYAPDAIPA